MKNKDRERRVNRLPIVTGYICFFLLVAGIVTIALFIYGVVDEKSGGDRTVISIIMLVVIVLLSLVFVVVDWLRRRYTVERPVKEILKATDDIASGKFSVRLTPRHSYGYYDEYDLIMENINKMSAELSKSATLSADFISNVSHELKTPLAIIGNYASALCNTSLDESLRKEYAKTLVSTSTRLAALITNILRLNKLENQEIKSESGEIRLDEMLAEAIIGYEELIESKNITLECDIDELTVVMPIGYLDIVWNNLLSNAVKFTPAGGKIAVSLARDRDKAVVKVADSGIGISKDTGERIFDKFYQGDTSHAKEGNGLGLALVKKVIDIIGGQIEVESELNKGSTFTVTLGGVIDKE